ISAAPDGTEVAPTADVERSTMARLVEDLERRLSAETRRRTRADERIATLEAALAEPAGDSKSEPEATVELHGLSLLYVGGRMDHVPRMRASAERRGATLAHHDGGVEESNGLLAGLIQRADAVLFPVDCVSHQATWLVKRLSRQAGKSFVPLRSAGLGAFLAALRDPAVSSKIRTMCH